MDTMLGRAGDLRRAGLALLSAITAAWVVALVAVALGGGSGLWPIAPFTMFAAKRGAAVTQRLEGVTRGGARVAVVPGDFHFTRSFELRHYLATRVARMTGARRWTVRPRARRSLGVLAAIWSRSHPRDPLASLTLDVRSRPLSSGASPRHETLTWYAP
jgi:hypothetical protein